MQVGSLTRLSAIVPVAVARSKSPVVAAIQGDLVVRFAQIDVVVIVCELGLPAVKGGLDLGAGGRERHTR